MATDLILDCDPGHDDAIALLLALQSPEITVRGVTTVAGNQTLPKTTHSALQVLTLANRTDVPVAAGMSEPIFRDLQVAEHVHGESGLDGPPLPDPETAPIDQHGVDFIAETAREHDGITLAPVGPLSNVGALLKRYPDIDEYIDRIVLMGGGVYQGNMTPAAEFNILVDPEAASLVFESDIPTTMVGLEVSRESAIPVDDFERFGTGGSQVANTVVGWLEYFVKFHQDEFGWDKVPIHDACAVADVIQPGIVETTDMSVVVETEGKYTLGETVCDEHGVTDRPADTAVGVDIDTATFHDLLVDSITAY